MGPDVADLLIVGAGAAGASVALRLAQAGLGVVCLERGGWMAPESGPDAAWDWERQRLGRWHPNPNVRRHAWDVPIDDAACPIRPLITNRFP